MVTIQQGWGGPPVQYRQSRPVLGNLGPVMDWRSNFGHPGIVRTCNEDLYWLASTREFWNCNGLDWWPFEDLPHPWLPQYSIFGIVNYSISDIVNPDLSELVHADLALVFLVEQPKCLPHVLHLLLGKVLRCRRTRRRHFLSGCRVNNERP